MTDTVTASAENRIRAAMRQLLGGPVPDGLKCDVKSLCQLSGVPRATFYRTYPHLRAVFEEQRGIGRAAGQQPDPRLAQIDRLESRSHRAAGHGWPQGKPKSTISKPFARKRCRAWPPSTTNSPRCASTPAPSSHRTKQHRSPRIRRRLLPQPHRLLLDHHARGGGLSRARPAATNRPTPAACGHNARI